MLKQWQANYHSHSLYCDGQGELEDYIRTALSRGITSLGFSPHGPVPFPNDWVMDEADIPLYKEEFLELKAKYQPELALYWGLEADYIPGLTDPLSMKKKYHFDFIIGSIHYLGQFPDGTYWTIDGSFGEFEKGLATVFNGDIKAVVQGYYALVKEMVTHYPPDIIGHLDLIKMHNRDNRFFSDTEDWYRQAVWETLQVIAASPCVVEMNTGGLARQRANDFYPTGWILAECARLGIPLTISSDAHKPDQLTGFFPEALSCLQKLDSPKLVRLSPDGWKNTSSSEPGYK